MNNFIFLLLFSMITAHGMASDDTSAAAAAAGGGDVDSQLPVGLGHLPVDVQKLILQGSALGIAPELLSQVPVKIMICQGHTDRVYAVAYAPDGDQIASASWDKTVRLWDSTDGTLQHTLEGHTGWVNAVAYAPDGGQIASASNDRTVRLWGADGTLQHTLTGHIDRVIVVAYAPDGSQIASGSLDDTVRLWNTDGTLQHMLAVHNRMVNAVAYAPDEKTLASGSDDSTVWLWGADGTLQHTLEGHAKGVRAVVYAPDGSQIASVSGDKTVRLWDIRQLNAVKKWLQSGCPSMKPVVTKDTNDPGMLIEAPPLFLYALVKKLLSKKDTDAPVELTIQEMGAWACLPREVQEALIDRIVKKEGIALTWGESLLKESEGLRVEDADDGSGAAGAAAASENGKDEQE